MTDADDAGRVLAGTRRALAAMRAELYLCEPGTVATAGQVFAIGYLTGTARCLLDALDALDAITALADGCRPMSFLLGGASGSLTPVAWTLDPAQVLEAIACRLPQGPGDDDD